MLTPWREPCGSLFFLMITLLVIFKNLQKCCFSQLIEIGLQNGTHLYFFMGEKMQTLNLFSILETLADLDLSISIDPSIHLGSWLLKAKGVPWMIKGPPRVRKWRSRFSIDLSIFDLHLRSGDRRPTPPPPPQLGLFPRKIAIERA